MSQLIEKAIATTKLKQFFWDVKDRRTVERGIGGYYNSDTTAVSTTSTTRVNLKTYTFTSSANTNKIRVRVYAYVSGAVAGSSIYLNINGTDVVGPVTVTATSSTLYIDYIGAITPSASQTIKVDGVAESGYTLYVSKVVIIAGLALVSITSVSILSITLDSADDVYTLNVSGNFVYKLGIRWWVKGNRKTTASASITSNLTNEIQGYYSPSASDDGDNNAIIQLRTGDYATSFSISGYVGASSDTIIITGIYCQIVLRGNNKDSLSIRGNWNLLIKEKGIVSIISRFVTIDGSSRSMEYDVITENNFKSVYLSSPSSDLTVGNLVFTVNNNPECIWHAGYGEDNYGFSMFLYVNIIVLGV
jgi:hypothetical protein